jgi:hypothetical protein
MNSSNNKKKILPNSSTRETEIAALPLDFIVEGKNVTDLVEIINSNSTAM